MSPNSQELSLADAFTAEHHQIDAGIDEYLASTEPLPGRAAPLLRAIEALRRHIYLEEEFVFPRLPVATLTMPLMVMHREHGAIWRHMDELSERLNDSATPAELDRVCNELLSLLDAHNLKEEPIIYPHMDASLDEQERARVRELLSGGELPAGWVCRDVR